MTRRKHTKSLKVLANLPSVVTHVSRLSQKGLNQSLSHDRKKTPQIFNNIYRVIWIANTSSNTCKIPTPTQMSYGSTGHDFLVCSKPCLPGAKSMLKPSPNHLIFNTNLPKPAFYLKTPSGYFTTRAKTAINSSHNLYLTEEASESFYCLLGVSEAATLSEIKQAYKQLVLKYHPDVSPPDSAKEFTRMFIRIQEAYETLSDPRTRDLYDSDLTKGLHVAFSAQKLYRSHQPVRMIFIYTHY